MMVKTQRQANNWEAIHFIGSLDRKLSVFNVGENGLDGKFWKLSPTVQDRNLMANTLHWHLPTLCTAAHQDSGLHNPNFQPMECDRLHTGHLNTMTENLTFAHQGNR